jgi:hypothetical protein
MSPGRTSPWQKKLATTRQPYLPKLVVVAATPCYGCHHPRSSHSEVILTHHCRVDGCDCPAFDPQCGCGHTLILHLFGTPPDHFACAQCACKQFGARLELTRI